MAKFIPYQKLHKKQQQALDRAKRGSWGEVNPVTRYAPDSDAYNRKTENRRWKADAHKEHGSHGGFCFYIYVW